MNFEYELCPSHVFYHITSPVNKFGFMHPLLFVRNDDDVLRYRTRTFGFYFFFAFCFIMRFFIATLLSSIFYCVIVICIWVTVINFEIINHKPEQGWVEGSHFYVITSILVVDDSSLINFKSRFLYLFVVFIVVLMHFFKNILF